MAARKTTTSAAAKSAAVNPAAAKKRPAPAAGPADGLRIGVRMYRQGLGDCFLLTLARPGQPAFRILIDCGVILGTEAAADKLRAVVSDVIATTADARGCGFVDVLAVTHEHYDHVAAFTLADDLFAKGGQRVAGRLAVGEVWFAWTEDPGNALAARLRKSRAERLAALTRIAAIGSAFGATLDDDIVESLRFFGVDAAASGKPGATAQAMANAASYAPKGGLRYLNPGEVLTPDAAPELRIYVLGPPADERWIRKTDATSGVYHLDRAELDGLAGMALGDGSGADDPQGPFESVYTYPLAAVAPGGTDTAPLAAFLAERYFGPATPTPETDLRWRRIDGDWQQPATDLALALDSATNNTSLVLAIEAVATGEVLLFPADAQVGNWLSWPEVKFADAAVTAPDLLARTVFYKVGHHGSHNATLKEQGLERMAALRLAFIPVDHAMALRKRWGRMPLEALVAALGQQCQGRVVRIDEALPEGLADVTQSPAGAPAPWYEWSLPVAPPAARRKAP